jgi:hypothetical protein
MSVPQPAMPDSKLQLVVVCKERLLPSFGAGRELLRRGRGLIAHAHRIIFICIRCYRATLEQVSLAIMEGKAEVARRLLEHWPELSLGGAPDAVVTEGWPFSDLAQVCRRFGVPSRFIDIGAAPQNGMGEGAKARQWELRRAHFEALVAPVRLSHGVPALALLRRGCCYHPPASLCEA